jgi:hypothetical protein
MRLDEIRKRYRNEWVLVEFSKLDKDLRVKDGKVRFEQGRHLQSFARYSGQKRGG